MADFVNVNGVRHDWASLTVVGPHGIFIDFTEINWKSKQPKKRLYGKGGAPRGVGRENYEAEWDITMQQAEYQRFALALTKGVYRDAFDLAITMTPPDALPTLIQVKDCRVDDMEDGAKQGEAEIGIVKLSGTAAMIVRDGKPDYENSLI